MNVAPGDLAILIHAELSENIGKIVEVVEFVGDCNGRQNQWLVTVPAPVRGIVLQSDLESVGTAGLAPDAWLRRVSGLPGVDAPAATEVQP